MTLGQRAKTAVSIAERRRRVAGLYLRHVDQVDIAEQVGVSQPTVCRDLAALKKEWRSVAASDTAERIALEVAELDQMERDCALQFHQQRTAEWITTRLAIKKRRADLLGLDAPKRSELTGRDGGPLELVRSPDFPVIMRTVIEAVPLEARVAVGAALEALSNGAAGS